MILLENHGEGSSSSFIRYGSSPQDTVLLTGEREKSAPFSTHIRSKEPFDMTIERFLASLRFKNKGKMDDLGLEIDLNTKNPSNSGSSPVSYYSSIFLKR